MVTQLESSLGADCEASKLFQALRWTYGHPRTCRSEAMSSDLDLLVSLSSRINAHKLFSVAGTRASTPLLSMDLLLHSGTDLRTALLDGLCRLREDRDYTTGEKLTWFFLTGLPPRDSTLDGRWTRKPFRLSRVHPIYLSIPTPS